MFKLCSVVVFVLLYACNSVGKGSVGSSICVFSFFCVLMITRSQLMAAKEAAGEVTLRQERVNDHRHLATTEADPTLAQPEPRPPNSTLM